MMSTFAAPVTSSSVAVQTARHAHYAKRIDDIGASRDYSGLSRLLLCYALEAPAAPAGFLVSPADRRVRIFSVKNVRVAVLRASD